VLLVADTVAHCAVPVNKYIRLINNIPTVFKYSRCIVKESYVFIYFKYNLKVQSGCVTDTFLKYTHISGW